MISKQRKGFNKQLLGERGKMKKSFVLHGKRFLTVAAFLVVLLLAHTSIVRAEETKKQDEWRFTLVPYIWLPSVSGSFNFTPPAGTVSGTRAAGAAAASGDADISSNDYLSNLQFAGMLSIEVAKGRWSILSDILYVDFSDSDRDATIRG